jgi:hypothetical protein
VLGAKVAPKVVSAVLPKAARAGNPDAIAARLAAAVRKKARL